MRFSISASSALLFLSGALSVIAQEPLSTELGLRASSQFPGGSARVLSVETTNNLVRITPAGDPARGWPCWWYVRLDGFDTNRPVVLEVVANQSNVKAGESRQIKPLAADWSLPARAAFSRDDHNWQQTAPGTRQNNRISYTVPGGSPTVWLAWGPPFGLREANQLIEHAASQSRFAKPIELTRTREWRPVPALRISQPGAPEAQRCSVWIQARQHAWECGGSWVCRGLIEWLVSTDPAAAALRQKADITLVPIMDVDNVETGNGGKGAQPTEQNEDWGTSPAFPEVKAAIELISAEVKKGRFAVFLDLHNPGAGAKDIMIYIPPKPMLDAVRLANQNAFTNMMLAHLTGPIAFAGRVGPCGTTYDPAVDKTSDAWAAYAGGSPTVSLTVETAWNTPASTSAGYSKVGEQLGRVLGDYLRHPPFGPKPAHGAPGPGSTGRL